MPRWRRRPKARLNASQSLFSLISRSIKICNKRCGVGAAPHKHKTHLQVVNCIFPELKIDKSLKRFLLSSFGDEPASPDQCPVDRLIRTRTRGGRMLFMKHANEASVCICATACVFVLLPLTPGRAPSDRQPQVEQHIVSLSVEESSRVSAAPPPLHSDLPSLD